MTSVKPAVNGALRRGLELDRGWRGHIASKLG
jgi:hypothetical protein